MQHNNNIFTLLSIHVLLLITATNTVQAFQQGTQCLSSPLAIPGRSRAFVSHVDTSYPSFCRSTQTQHVHLNSPTKLDAFTVGTALAVADTFWKTSPYTAAALVCAIKNSVADLVAQTYFTTPNKLIQQNQKSETPEVVVPERNKADWRRNIAYAIYGSVYQGIIQEYMFNHMYSAFFGTGTDLKTAVVKVAFNLFIHAPLFTIPIAYVVKAMLYKHSMREAFSKYVNDIRYHGLLTKFYMLWGPVQSLTFSVVPPHLRVTFIAVISFFWMIILSATASKPSPDESKA